MQVEIKGLVKRFDTEGGSLTVLQGLDFSMASSGIALIEGASGSGKSTLLNIIATIDSPTAGSVVVGRQEITTLKERQKEDFRAWSLGLIFQHHYLLPDFTVLENTIMPMLIQHYSFAAAREEGCRMLEMVGLQDRLQHYPSQISGGEMARVGVARALVGKKRLILADEPSGNLDRENSNLLADLLWELQESLGFGLIIATHDLDLARRVKKRYKLIAGHLQDISQSAATPVAPPAAPVDPPATPVAPPAAPVSPLL